MPQLVLVMLVSSVTVDFLMRMRIVPGVVTFLPEMLGALALLYVVGEAGRGLFRHVRPAYWFVMGGIVLVMVSGVLINRVEAGPIFIGIRNYMRAIPFFLLPAVFLFRDSQIRTQLRTVMLLCFLQLPIALYQKSQPYVTGDSIYGTLMISSHLSIFLICSSCVLTGLFLRRKIAFTPYIVLLVLFLIPTTINETKGSLVLLPLGLAAAFILGAQRGHRLKNATLAAALLGVFGTIFVAVYDYTQKDRLYRPGIVEFFTEGSAERYVESGKGFTQDRREIGRLDAIKTPLAYLERDPITLTFGLGIGNVSVSSLGSAFHGRYSDIFEPYLLHTAARLLLEIGLLGCALVLILMGLILRDAYLAATSGALTGAIAVGWMGVVLVLTLAMFYKDVMAATGITFPFWYFAGLVATHRMRVALGATAPADVVTSTAGHRATA